jgi:parallel beta-helix repeat protein
MEDEAMKFLSHFVGKKFNNLNKTMAPAMLAGLTLLFAVQAWAADPIPVTTCGTVISTPGDYQLVNDLVNCPQDGIDIVSSDVHLILNGHQISGTGGNVNTNGIAVGIGVPTGVSNVKINGPATISNFGQAGVAFEGVSSSTVVGVTSTGNKFGFAVNAAFGAGNPSLRSTGNKFNGNTATANAAHGFTLNGADQNTFRGNDSSGNGLVFGAEGLFLFDATGNVVEGNTFDQNSSAGVLAQGGIGINNTVRGNTAQGNAGFDLQDNNGGCANVWQGNTFGSANQACIQ